jgi:hypothetical protein
MVPDISIYCSGYKIKCDIDHNSKRIFFSILDDRMQTDFSILVADSIVFETESNTVKYLKINQHKKYKFYTLRLKEIVNDDPHNKEALPQSKFVWQIREERLFYANGRIPDATIIICYNPSFIETMRGGNSVEFPTIVIKPDILTVVGSELNLHDSSVQLLLSSLDYNALHSRTKEEIKQDAALKSILAITT